MRIDVSPERRPGTRRLGGELPFLRGSDGPGDPPNVVARRHHTRGLNPILFLFVPTASLFFLKSKRGGHSSSFLFTRNGAARFKAASRSMWIGNRASFKIR